MNHISQKLAVVLAGAALSCAVIEAKSAQAATFTFRQTGFFDTSFGAPPFSPFEEAFLEGTFTGEDLNDDQTIELGELTDFSALFSFFADGDLSFVVDRPELSSFAYNLTSMALTFAGGVPGVNEIVVEANETNVGLRTGTLPTQARSTEPVVVTQVPAQPVPEPGLGFALGLLGVGGLLKQVTKKGSTRKNPVTQ